MDQQEDDGDEVSYSYDTLTVRDRAVRRTIESEVSEIE